METTQSPQETITLAWGARVNADFVRYLVGIIVEFGWSWLHLNWLMACIAFESGATFSPSVLNRAGSGAVGLIQFMPQTALGLGTTVEQLAKLSAESQLAYVRLYFRPYARRIQTLSDMYMAILLPKYVGALDTAVLFAGGTAYRQNSGLDTDRDGKVTKREATARVQVMLTLGLQPGNVAAYALPAAA